MTKCRVLPQRVLMSGKDERLAYWRLTLIEEVLAVGSPSEVSQREGITPQTLRNWQRRYRSGGVKGLVDEPRLPSTGRPKAIQSGAQDILLELVRRSPGQGCLPLASELSLRGYKVSPPTVQKCLNSLGLGKKAQRLNWVNQGCPRIVPVALPLPDPPGTPRGMALAKRYFFFGIPGNSTRSPEVPTPTLQAVATRIGLPIEDVSRAATREHWVEGRLRLEERFADEELRRVLLKQAHHHLRVLLSGAPALFKGFQLAWGEQECPPPGETLAWAHALTTTYSSIKWALGGPLPSRKGDHPLTDGAGQSLPSTPAARRRRRAGSDTLGEEAKRLFFRGIPPVGSVPGIPSPSVRQIADHLGLPLKPLQHRATGEGWFGSRKEAESLFDQYWWERLRGQVNPDDVKVLIRNSIRGLTTIVGWVSKTLHQETPTPSELHELVRALRLGLKLRAEIERDLENPSSRLLAASILQGPFAAPRPNRT